MDNYSYNGVLEPAYLEDRYPKMVDNTIKLQNVDLDTVKNWEKLDSKILQI